MTVMNDTPPLALVCIEGEGEPHWRGCCGLAFVQFIRAFDHVRMYDKVQLNRINSRHGSKTSIRWAL